MFVCTRPFNLPILGITDELMLREYNPPVKALDENCGKIQLDEKSKYVAVTDNNGKEKVVCKSAICYVLLKIQVSSNCISWKLVFAL